MQSEHSNNNSNAQERSPWEGAPGTPTGKPSYFFDTDFYEGMEDLTQRRYKPEDRENFRKRMRHRIDWVDWVSDTVMQPLSSATGKVREFSDTMVDTADSIREHGVSETMKSIRSGRAHKALVMTGRELSQASTDALRPYIDLASAALQAGSAASSAIHTRLSGTEADVSSIQVPITAHLQTGEDRPQASQTTGASTGAEESYKLAQALQSYVRGDDLSAAEQ